MLSAPGFPDYLGWLGILVGVLWVLDVFTKIFFPLYLFSGIVLFTFLLWVFLTGFKLLRLAGQG
ncbi:MAG: hypothetical protein ACE5IC_08965 [Candidatus Brocadiales bacterium]